VHISATLTVLSCAFADAEIAVSASAAVASAARFIRL
jgi:hypothetical protein